VSEGHQPRVDRTPSFLLAQRRLTSHCSRPAAVRWPGGRAAWRFAICTRHVVASGRRPSAEWRVRWPDASAHSSGCYTGFVKPRLFLGCSADDLVYVGVLAELLEQDAEVMAWAEDVLTLSDTASTGLRRVLDSADFAAFFARSVDGREKRWVPSPNVVLELGMCVGTLGIDRTVLILEGVRPDLPSDIRGLHYFKFARPANDTTLRMALGPVAVLLRRWMRSVGDRAARNPERASPSEVVATPQSPPLRAPSRRSRSRRGGVFISYCHADSKWLARIQTMLTPLIRADQIVVWDDTKIKPGAKWRSEIQNALDEARVALLLVSPAFLASSFIADEELPPILSAAQEQGLVILWALVSSCMYKKTPIAEYQAAHRIVKPLDALSPAKRNEALLAIAETVGSALEVGAA